MSRVNINAIAFFLILTASITGCSGSQSINATAPHPSAAPHYLDTEIKDLSATLIEEQRKLARIRQSKLDAMLTDEDRKRQASMNRNIVAGFDKKVSNFEMYNDVEVTLRAISALVGWGADRVYQVGIRPANGLLVKVRLDNEMLHNALVQIDAQLGNVADVRVDPNFQTILITYKSLNE